MNQYWLQNTAGALHIHYNGLVPYIAYQRID